MLAAPQSHGQLPITQQPFQGQLPFQGAPAPQQFNPQQFAPQQTVVTKSVSVVLTEALGDALRSRLLPVISSQLQATRNVQVSVDELASWLNLPAPSVANYGLGVTNGLPQLLGSTKEPKGGDKESDKPTSLPARGYCQYKFKKGKHEGRFCGDAVSKPGDLFCNKCGRTEASKKQAQELLGGGGAANGMAGNVPGVPGMVTGYAAPPGFPGAPGFQNTPVGFQGAPVGFQGGPVPPNFPAGAPAFLPQNGMAAAPPKRTLRCVPLNKERGVIRDAESGLVFQVGPNNKPSALYGVLVDPNNLASFRFELTESERSLANEMKLLDTYNPNMGFDIASVYNPQAAAQQPQQQQQAGQVPNQPYYGQQVQSAPVQQQLPFQPVPAQQLPSQPAPAQQLPFLPAPAQQLPVQQLPVQPAPVQQLPGQLPFQSAPVQQQLPVQQLPVQPAPVQQLPGQLPVQPAPGTPQLPMAGQPGQAPPAQLPQLPVS